MDPLILAQREKDPARAKEILNGALRKAPRDADLHYELALVHEELGDRDAMIASFLEVHRLDPLADRAAGLIDDALREEIVRLSEQVLEALPAQFKERLGPVAVVVDDYPPKYAIEAGLDPRAFGMFEGPSDFEQHSGAAVLLSPTRIMLFAANLAADFAGRRLEEEVQTTILHEIGHYFGLDEDEVAALGLA